MTNHGHDPDHHPSDERMPDVQVFLSRSAYSLGGVVVGTILVRPPPPPPPSSSSSRSNTQQQQQQQQHHTTESIRAHLKSLVVYVAGFCKIDARWHTVADYTKIYGTSHPFLQLLVSQEGFDADLLAPPGADETVCFWATNGLELLELAERETGAIWNTTTRTTRTTREDEDQDHHGDYDPSPLLAYSFRVEIPKDLPHSMHGTTCRYHYSADVLLRTATKQRVVKTPFIVWANPQQPLGIPRSQQIQHRKQQQQQQQQQQEPRGRQNRLVISGARVKFGTCQGMAHSHGFPCHLSPTERHRPKGQMSVAMATPHEDVQSLRVSNAKGQPVCVMTIVGATQLTPGSRIHLQWDFPERISATKAWIPCHQVAACLAGDEWALYEDGHTAKTQSYVLDTCHEWVDPGVTRRVSQTLLLSVDAPCNLYTDVMELFVRCRVDITVKEDGEYNNLRIEFPCHVVHHSGVTRRMLDEDEEQQMLPLSELLHIDTSKDPFPTTDIETDLKILALQMEERLRPTNNSSAGYRSRVTGDPHVI